VDGVEDDTIAGDSADPVGPRAGEEPVFINVNGESRLGTPGASRCAWGDYDNDGELDLLINGPRLFKNNGDGTFRETTAVSGLQGPAGGGVWGDYDNDGLLDLFTFVYSLGAQERLWHNNGDGTFTDVTESAGGVWIESPTEAAAWGDGDNDGDLDLYVTGYEYPLAQDDDQLGVGTPDAYFRNNGNGTFTNVTREAGMWLDLPTCGRGVTFGDFDNDGDSDIYVSNYRLDPNLLWVNQGDGTFINQAEERGVEGNSPTGNPSTFGHSIGAQWGDLDLDGDLDLVVANLAHPQYLAYSDITQVFINSGSPDYRFESPRLQSLGIAYEETHSSVSLADYDLDGDLDLYITSVYEDRPSFLYRNDLSEGDGLSFTDVTGDTNTLVNDGWGCAWADFDHDGDQDIMVGSQNRSRSRLFQNSGNLNHYLRVKVVPHDNGTPVGVRLQLEREGFLPTISEITAGHGTGCQGDPAAHFGLGRTDRGGVVKVRWACGMVTSHGFNSTDMELVIREPDHYTDCRLQGPVTGPESFLAGEDYTLGAVVVNLGDHPMQEGIVQLLDADDNDTVLDQVRLEPLATGDSREVEFDHVFDAGGTVQSLSFRLTEVYPRDRTDSDDRLDVSFLGRTANEPPTAILEIDTPRAQFGQEVVMSGSASKDDVDIAEYAFDFGDGNVTSGNSSTVKYSYRQVGQFTINLTVTDTDGAVAYDTDVLNVIPRKGNSPPELLSVTPSNDTVVAGGTLTISADAVDPDGDDMTYHWEAGDGTMDISSGNGSVALWTAPQTPGSIRLSLRVSDGMEWSIERSITVRVTSSVGNIAPSVISVDVTPGRVPMGGSAEVHVEGHDPEGQPLTYHYIQEGGTVEGSSQRVIWHPPEQPGVHTIEVWISDGEAQSTHRTASVEVLRNRNPQIRSLRLDDKYAEVGGSVTGSVTIDEPDGHDTSLIWDPEDGQVDCDGSGTFTWSGFTLQGEASLSLRVTDPYGGEDEADAEVTVLMKSVAPTITGVYIFPSVVPADDDTEVELRVNISDGNGADDISRVRVDLSPFGGRRSAGLSRSGSEGVEVSYVTTFTVDTDTTPGIYKVAFNVTDASGRAVNSSGILTVTRAGDDTLYSPQDDEGLPGFRPVTLSIAMVVVVMLMQMSSGRKRKCRGG